MPEGLTLSFTDPATGIYGWMASSNGFAVALGCGPGGAGSSAMVDGVEMGGSPESIEGRLEGDEVGFEIAFHAEGPVLALDLDLPDSPIQATASLGTVTGSATSAGAPVTLACPALSWHFEGGDPTAMAAARTAWAQLEDGSLLAMIAVRDEQADEHGAEHRAAAISSEGEPLIFDEPLLSTEYDAAGRHTRATLELWERDSGSPVRGAGIRAAGGAIGVPLARLEGAAFDWLIDGADGIGTYEIISRS